MAEELQQAFKMQRVNPEWYCSSSERTCRNLYTPTKVLQECTQKPVHLSIGHDRGAGKEARTSFDQAGERSNTETNSACCPDSLQYIHLPGHHSNSADFARLVLQDMAEELERERTNRIIAQQTANQERLQARASAAESASLRRQLNELAQQMEQEKKKAAAARLQSYQLADTDSRHSSGLLEQVGYVPFSWSVYPLMLKSHLLHSAYIWSLHSS